MKFGKIGIWGMKWGNLGKIWVFYSKVFYFNHTCFRYSIQYFSDKIEYSANRIPFGDTAFKFHVAIGIGWVRDLTFFTKRHAKSTDLEP